jgi:sortase B
VNVFENHVLDPVPYDTIMELIDRDSVSLNTSIRKSNRILALSTCTEPVSSNRLLVFCYVYD